MKIELPPFSVKRKKQAHLTVIMRTGPGGHPNGNFSINTGKTKTFFPNNLILFALKGFKILRKIFAAL